MRLNKRGVIGGPDAAFLAAVTLNLIATYFVTDSFRERKAVEFCVSNGVAVEECVESVKKMSKEDILAYIKDDKMSPTGLVETNWQ
jgi:hypothetical protein